MLCFAWVSKSDIHRIHMGGVLMGGIERANKMKMGKNGLRLFSLSSLQLWKICIRIEFLTDLGMIYPRQSIKGYLNLIKNLAYGCRVSSFDLRFNSYSKFKLERCKWALSRWVNQLLQNMTENIYHKVTRKSYTWSRIK